MKKHTFHMATTAFIFSIIAFPIVDLSFFAILIATYALIKIGDDKTLGGKSFAIAAIILSVIALLVSAL